MLKETTAMAAAFINARDIEAADFIVSLWGKKRRAFARRYWLFMAYGREEPWARECFGAERIALKLELIWHKGKVKI